MAFGDLVKSDRDYNSGATGTADLGSNPTSGNLLICGVSNGTSSESLTTPPSGFTELHSSTTGGGNWYWYYKISVGTEQTAAAVWSGPRATTLLAEYEWDGSTPTVTKNEDVTGINSATSTQASGAATPTSSKNILIAAHGSDASWNSETGQAVDGSWIEDILFTTDDNGDMKFSRLVSVTGSQEATHTDTDTGDQMYGAIAVFDVAASGGSGRIMSSLTNHGGLAGRGGIAGIGGGLAG